MRRNDGVQHWGLQTYTIAGDVLEQHPDWLPAIGKRWRVYFGECEGELQVAIALHKPYSTPQETWHLIASGKWSKTWPIYLAYAAMVHSHPRST